MFDGTPILSLALVFPVTACGTGEWVVSTWGESYIEEEIPASDFEDGCRATYDRFDVELTDAALLNGNRDVVGEVGGARIDLTEPGPRELGRVAVGATHYDRARFVIAPAGGSSVAVAGTLACGSTAVRFDWSFDTATTYGCEPEGLTVPAGGEVFTELTIHGDHLFYDGLENDDAVLRGQAMVEADADVDGVVTLSELADVPVAGLGYAVGQYSEVADLRAFVAHLTRTLGHVDGEGHCQVDL